MPNPFPGMNPYFENPLSWRETHAALIYCFRAALDAALPAPFQARREERVYLQEVEKDYVADALVVERFAPITNHKTGKNVETASLTVHPKDVDAPHHPIFNAIPEREPFIEIRSRRDGQAVIAVVDFLSPTIKTSAIRRNEYLRKQNDVLHSNTHLFEIDLLRAGQYSLPPPRTRVARTTGQVRLLNQPS